MRPVQPLTLDEERIERGLIAKGWSPAAARQYAVEMKFRRRGDRLPAIEAARGDGCRRRPLSADQAIQEVRLLHSNKMERNREHCLTEDGQTNDLG
jgi:hypothetical protein